MVERTVLDEGGSVSVHTRIKDMCKAARNRLGYTNQDICDKISQRFGIEDFSLNTVNNFFSERSKAATIYTTGYICAVLDISIDAVFGIENGLSPDEEKELVKQLTELKAESRISEQRLEYLEKTVAEKEDRLKQAHVALEHYRRESEANRKKVQPWVMSVTLFLLTVAIIFICVYIYIFDIGNPDFGLFGQSLAASAPVAAGILSFLP